jgi:hypothetical protein
MKYKHWSKPDIAKLTEIYADSCYEKLAKEFPGRDIIGIRTKARKLGLRRDSSLYEPIMPSLSETEKAYIAGLFDGEGCVHIAVNKPRPKGINPYHQLMVCVANTNQEIIKYLFDSFGGRVADNVRKENQQPCQTWWIYAKEANAFLKLIFPYLRIKKLQAEIAIKFQSEIQYTGKNVSPETLEKRETYRKSIVHLKGAHLRL